jgi:prepilin-type N-terminal cleavage/methylation domain-containing protein
MKRRAVTLVELLITLAIMAIIAAAVLGTASAAMESARRSRTQSTITKLDRLLTEALAGYATRRVDVHPDYRNSITFSFRGADAGRATQDVRLLAARELIKYEMPDRWTDVIDDPKILNAQPSLAIRYRSVYANLKGDAATKARYQGAETLFLVVMAATGDGEARTQFQSAEIGDVDEDGAQEFVDGWGNPISWLRWPEAFGPPSTDADPLDPYRRDKPDSTGPTANQYKQQEGEPRLHNVAKVLGEFLPALRDDRPARYVAPLVYSMGRDGESGINAKADDWAAGLNPFSGEGVGQVQSEAATDNLHNYVQEY